jgi:hypothetical protein
MNSRRMLDSLPEAGRITLHAGQVLVYPRHTPPGVFVALTGVLCRFADGTVPEAGCGERLDAASGAFAVPAPDEVKGPAAAGIAARTDVELVFVPRSVVLERTDLARIFAAFGVAIVPLRERLKAKGDAVTPRSAR